MRKLLQTVVLVVLAAASGAPAQADTTSAGGVTYTFTAGGVDGGGVFDVILMIDTTGATASGNLSSFSVQFTGASSVTVESSPDGLWHVLGQGPNNPSGCNINGNANHWCLSDVGGSGIGVSSGGPGGMFSFVFDVNMGNNPLPSLSHIQAFQGQGALAISNDVGIGGGTTSVPEPSSLALLGTGLLGLAGFVRRKVTW